MFCVRHLPCLGEGTPWAPGWTTAWYEGQILGLDHRGECWQGHWALVGEGLPTPTQQEHLQPVQPQAQQKQSALDS